MRVKHLSGLLLLFGAGLLLLARPAPLRAQAGPAKPPQETGTAVPAALSTEKKANHGLFHPRCARCHDADGTGRSARNNNVSEMPDFTSHKWQASRTDAQLLVGILDGKGKHMPAYRDKLTEKEARDMVAQLRGLDPAPAAPTPAAAAPAAATADDFERRFRELKKELEDLKKQSREQSAPPPKP
jgi:mono/diheme cytochrome c family protein